MLQGGVYMDASRVADPDNTSQPAVVESPYGEVNEKLISLVNKINNIMRTIGSKIKNTFSSNKIKPTSISKRDEIKNELLLIKLNQLKINPQDPKIRHVIFSSKIDLVKRAEDNESQASTQEPPQITPQLLEDSFKDKFEFDIDDLRDSPKEFIAAYLEKNLQAMAGIMKTPKWDNTFKNNMLASAKEYIKEKYRNNLSEDSKLYHLLYHLYEIEIQNWIDHFIKILQSKHDANHANPPSQ